MLNTIRSAFLFFILLATSARAQTITELPTWYIYPGNPGEKQLVFPLADSARLFTARLMADRNGRVLAPALQPQVTKTISPAGVQVTMRFAVTKLLPGSAYLIISVDGLIRFGRPVSVSTQNVTATDPKSLTVLYPPGTVAQAGTAPPAPAPVTALSIWQQLMSLLF